MCMQNKLSSLTKLDLLPEGEWSFAKTEMKMNFKAPVGIPLTTLLSSIILAEIPTDLFEEVFWLEAQKDHLLKYVGFDTTNALHFEDTEISHGRHCLLNILLASSHFPTNRNSSISAYTCNAKQFIKMQGAGAVPGGIIFQQK